MSEEAPERRRRTFRWQALLQNASEAVFVLDRRRRLLFVNPAWETLTGLSAERARGLFCRRPRPVPVDAPLEEHLAHVLTPPPEVVQGIFARTRRLFHPRPPRDDAPAPRWWDIEFFPLLQAKPEQGYLIVGRVIPRPAEEPTLPLLLPERLVSLRQRRVETYTLALLDSLSPVMQRLARQVRLASALATPVLLAGEPGTGKETVARLLHYLGPEREHPFATLDCQRLPATAIASVLLPDAAAPRTRLGAVYLRQPQRLPRDLQLRLAEWLSTAASGPRLLAGCAAPLEEMRAGRLLSDLYWLLSSFTLEVPPLRERRDDLPRLVENLLAGGEKAIRGLTPAAWEVMQAHDWPGNLAELRQVLEEARQRTVREWIDAADLPASMRLRPGLSGESTRPGRLAVPLERLLEEVERRVIELALRRVRGNRKKAAELLGIHRARLLRRLEALGLEPGEARLEPVEDEPEE